MTEELNEYQVCYRHPDRKTLLRCNKCGRPICLECAVRTPTGYRCKDCIKEQQKVFDTSQPKDLVIGSVIAFVLGYIGALVHALIPFFYILTAVAVGAVFGRLINAAVRKAVQKRRSRTLTIVVTAAAGLGALADSAPVLLMDLQMMGTMGVSGFFYGLENLLIRALYAIVLCFTIRTEGRSMIFRR